jgi:hypothetical protein
MTAPLARTPHRQQGSSRPANPSARDATQREPCRVRERDTPRVTGQERALGALARGIVSCDPAQQLQRSPPERRECVKPLHSAAADRRFARLLDYARPEENLDAVADVVRRLSERLGDVDRAALLHLAQY